MKRFLIKSLVCALAALGLTGCGSSQSTNNPVVAKKVFAADSASPELAVRTFLEAVRTGDDKKASSMLTPTARAKTAERDLTVAPPGSATAHFEIGAVEYVTPEKDGAHVASAWTDVDLEGKPNTDQIVWVLRKEDEGWRIAGMAVKIFENELPLILNFEDPDDMIRKQKMASEEIARRSNATANEKNKGVSVAEEGTLK
ncbi:MAG TPA: hypothetical protein VFE24_02030 [Pirellulales bacterium]|jgi:hypothetical protein|nr:hypothetical protein [Pirellulales bacterium]